MTGKIIDKQFYPSSAVPSVFAKSGRHPSEPIPLGWVEAVVNEVRQKFGNEADNCLVSGFSDVTLVGPHEQTEQERTEALLHSVRQAGSELSTALPREGEPMTKEAFDSLQALAMRLARMAP